MFKNNDKKRDIIEYYCEKKSSRRISTVPYLLFNSRSKFKACKIINIPQLNIATIIKGIKDKNYIVLSL